MWSQIKRIIRQILNPGEDFNQRVVSSGFWVFALRITERSFNLLRLLILARILAPHDFGLLGIALLTMAALERFSEPGFGQALIQKKDDIESYLNTAWTFKILRSVILFIIIYLISPYVAFFFETSEAEPIIQAIGLCILFSGFNNIGTIYFRKELEFNREFAFRFSRTIVDFVVAVSAAIILQSVWALVYGKVASTLVACIVSYLIHPYRPRLSFDLPKARELFTFGKWVMGSTILIFLLTQGDDIFVGKLLGAAALGFYQLAYRISNMPATEITKVISQVTFPAYSKLQDNVKKLRKSYLMVLQFTTFLSIPLAGMILVLASDFTRLFLGEKWMPMVPAMQVLAIFGLLRSIGATTGPVFMAVGKPELVTKITFIRLFLMLALIYPLTITWGIVGASIAVVLSILLLDPIAYFLVIKITKCSVSEFGKMIIFPFLGTAVMVSPFIYFKYYLVEIGVISFFGLIALALILYLLMVYIFDRYTSYNFSLVKKQLSAIKGD
ncbi:MAG: lipopolysaccharide biosynthesis protein [Halobacteriota archaeon]